MVSFFIKKFIADSADISSPAVRRAYGAVCGMCGIGINLLLFLGKLTAGLISGSIAIMADAFNNLSDAGSSIVTLAGFRLAAQAPDKDHPFGHGRFEYIAGLLVSVAILLMGGGLFRSGVEKIINPESVKISPLVFTILAVSILFKLYMAFYNNKYGKMIGSPALRATATDSLSDCAATTAVLIAALIEKLTGISADGWAGVLVAGFIIYAGIKSVRETVSPLLGHAPDDAFIRQIEETVMSHSEARGIHDLAVHDYGPGRLMVSLHVEVNGEGSVYELHEVIDSMEREISQRLGCETVIHIDPVANDSLALAYKVEQLIKQHIDPEITIHDFKAASGPKGDVLTFDSAVPNRLSAEADNIKGRIERLIKEEIGADSVNTKIDISYK